MNTNRNILEEVFLSELNGKLINGKHEYTL